MQEMLVGTIVRLKNSPKSPILIVQDDIKKNRSLCIYYNEVSGLFVKDVFNNDTIEIIETPSFEDKNQQ